MQDEFQAINLINNNTIQKYLQKEYNYIHIGLVQVAVKPLVHIGVYASIYLALRDKRLKKYKSSLLTMIQTNICNGPIYFDCSPNFSLDLTDLLILQSLILDIHLKGDEFERFAKNFAIIYRVYFRVMGSHLNPRFNRLPTFSDETILLHLEAEQSTTFVPKRLK